MPDDDNRAPFERAFAKVFSVLDGPVTAFREKFVEPTQSKNKQYYYHRRYRRVPAIDECFVNDSVCIFEANEQYRRDKHVDDQILGILRQRRIECEHYHGHDSGKYCQKVKEDYLQSEANWFAKYGDLGGKIDVRNAYMKQKHRLLWERRHGQVGTGMKTRKLSDTD